MHFGFNKYHKLRIQQDKMTIITPLRPRTWYPPFPAPTNTHKHALKISECNHTPARLL